MNGEGMHAAVPLPSPFTLQPLLRHLLAWAADALRATSTTPRLDAEILLAHVLGWPRTRLLAESHQQLDTERLAAFQQLVARRAAQEPVAYLVGHREFYGLDFLVDPRVLIPRPETEQLVERALAIAATWAAEQAEQRNAGSTHPFTLVDVGTGSGAIAIALAVHLPAARVYAVDLSADALAVAAANAAQHSVAERVRFLHGDLLDPLPEPVDLIVSNPPYTVLAEIDAGVRQYEPHLALDGGSGGLAVYARLLGQAARHVRRGGALLLEIGESQGQAVIELVRAAFPGAAVELYQDFAGLDRVIAVRTTANTPVDRKLGDQGGIVRTGDDRK